MIFGLFGGEKKRNAELIAAARAGDTEKVSKLLSKGADINAADPESGETPLLAALDKAQWSTAEFLLRQRANLSVADKNGHAPLYVALGHGDAALAMVNRLLEAGAPSEQGPTRGDHAGATPLHLASAIGANGCVESLLRHGASAKHQRPGGATPLHAAAVGGDLKTVLQLSNAGGDVHAAGDQIGTPLHHCGSSGNVKVATALIRLGAKVDVTDHEDCTPLMRAVMKNQVEVAKLLLANGANPDVVVQTDDTPLYPVFVAAMNGYEEMMRALIEAGANVTAKVKGAPPPLDAAKHKGHAATAEVLAAAIKRKKAGEKEARAATKASEGFWQQVAVAMAQQDQEGLRKLRSNKLYQALSVDARLLVACAMSDVDHARELIKAGANPNAPCSDELLGGMTPLVVTVGLSRSVEVATLLLESGAEVNQKWGDGTAPILETTADQFFDLAQLMVSKGADVNVCLEDGKTPLIQAARNGAARCVDLFLDAGANINAVETEHDMGAFGWALNRLDLKLAEHLLARGAEPRFGDIETLPLAVAEHGSLAFVKALVERDCQLVRDDQRGRMAFVSARNPDPEVFDYLLNHGADPSEGNDFGYTPLILAALNNRGSLIRRYMTRGDDASARDVDGETALSLALEKRHHEAVAALREFHAEEREYPTLAPEAAMLKAAEDGALGTILKLHDDGVPINVKDADGNSPLMLAVRAGHHGVVRSLYHLGADLNYRNRDGKTALRIARDQELTATVNSLQEFGALDAMEGELGQAFAALGGVHVWNAADVMVGRTSHPYKQQPPYEDAESEDDEDEVVDEEDEDEDESGDRNEEDGKEHKVVLASVESKLDALAQILERDDVIEDVPDDLLEQFAQKLDDWRSKHQSEGLDDDELAELNRLLGLLALSGEAEENEEAARTPLFDAVHANDVSAVRKIIKGGGDVNEVDGEGNTPLLIAVLTGQAKLVDELLKLGADPNQARPDGKGPLFGAVRVEDEKLVQALLKGAAKADAPFSMEHNGAAVGGCTALYVAATLGHLPCCRALLSNGAQIDAANDIGYTPLMAAIEGDHEAVIDFLLKAGANVNPEATSRLDIEGLGGTFPLYTASSKEDVAVVKKLLKRGADVNRRTKNGWTALKAAAHKGSLEIVKALLDAGADPNIADNTNYTPLMNATSGEHEDIVKLLLKFHADPNIQSAESPGDDDWEPGRTALMDAAVSGNVPIARDLLRHGANPNLQNGKGRTALHSAVISKDTDMVSLLLKSGADPSVYGNEDDRNSALDIALRQWAKSDEYDRLEGPSDVLELMFQKGVPADRGSLNDAAIDLLAEGRMEVLGVLQEHGISVDPNASSSGTSPLFMFAAVGDSTIEAAEALLKIGANAGYRSPTGLSVLSLAARSGAIRLSRALLDAGADVMDRNIAGILAYDMAAIYGHAELVAVLISAMNRVVPEVDRQDAEGNTALMQAVRAADTIAIRALLSRHADASRRDVRGESPLSYAVTHDLSEVEALLRSAGAERVKEGAASGGVPIVTASKLGALGTVLDLLDSGVSVDSEDANGDTALTAAAVHPGVVKVLAKKGAGLAHRNREGKTAYMVAAASNRVLMVQVLEELGAPIESKAAEVDGVAKIQAMLKAIQSKGVAPESDDGTKPDPDDLLMACLTGDAVTVSAQIAAGADVNYANDEGRTALAMAIQGSMQDGLSRRRARDFDQVIDTILQAGADPKVGQFPYLVFAAMAKRLHLVNALLRAGADVNQSVGDGQTALFMSLLAPDAGQPIDDRCAVVLLKAGADPSLKHESGTMPIHLAAASNYVVALKALLERRPQEIDAKTNIGITPLMMAATEGHAEAVRVLLQFGADRSLADDEGLTAKEVAIKNGHEDLLALLS